ncbi:MAG: endonuclease/exonuclease/phosphatase family protein [Pseudomonadota bacterium]
MDITFLTWNVEHFNGKKGAEKAGRVARVISEIRAHAPDVFGILEVEAATAFGALAEALTDYNFHLTEGTQTQEILIGWRKSLRAFVTQKGAFKENNIYLRPASLLTIYSDSGRPIPVLFGHFKSSSAPEGFGLRAAMVEKVSALKRSMDRAAPLHGLTTAPMVFLGDINTMGLTLTDSPDDIPEAEEIARITRRLARRNLRPLLKSHPATYFDGSDGTFGESDLDHIFIDGSIDVVPTQGHEALVAGWALEPEGAERDAWIASMSDHAPVVARLRFPTV